MNVWTVGFGIAISSSISGARVTKSRCRARRRAANTVAIGALRVQSAKKAFTERATRTIAAFLHLTEPWQMQGQRMGIKVQRRAAATMMRKGHCAPLPAC